MNNIYFILHQPKKSGNVGSVARIMKNFGLQQLRIISKRNPAATFQSKKMSVHAYDILQKARNYDTIPEAVKDLHIVIGTTGKYHKDAPETVQLSEIGTAFAKGVKSKIGIVFGPEDRGLSGEELAYCNYSLTIPASSEYTSLNLSHAAGVVAYEIFRQTAEIPASLAKTPATRASMERMYENMRELYFEIGFLDKVNPQRMMKMIRNIYDRACPDEREAKILLGILKQINWYIKNKSAGS